MHTITLYLKEHNDEERIFVGFPYNIKINTAVRQIAGVKWMYRFKIDTGIAGT